MKRQSIKKAAASLLLVAVMLFSPLAASAQVLYAYPETDKDKIVSPGAMVMYMGTTAENDRVIYAKDADTRYHPGALLRVMMGCYAMEAIDAGHVNIDTQTGKYSLDLFNQYVSGTGIASAGMTFGEEWKIRDLLTLSMISTASDAAVTLAARLSGSVEAFVDGMNGLAQKWGCTNTHFVNVTGLDDDGQYMSVRDVATISRHISDYPVLLDLVQNNQYSVKPVSGGSTRSWPTSNDMMRRFSAYQNTDVIYGRTGATDYYNLMVVGKKWGYQYMVITMGSPLTDGEGKPAKTHITDAQKLLTWAFSKFSYTTVINDSEVVDRAPVKYCWSKDTVVLVPRKEVSTILGDDISTDTLKRSVVYKKKTLTAPIKKGEELATLILSTKDGGKLVEIPLVAGESLSRSEVLVVWDKVYAVISSPYFVGLLVLLLMLFIGYIILNIQHNRKRRKRKMEERKSSRQKDSGNDSGKKMNFLLKNEHK